MSNDKKAIGGGEDLESSTITRPGLAHLAEAESDDKLHYYLFVFEWRGTGESGKSNLRVGWAEPYVNEARIAEAARGARPVEAEGEMLLLNVAYLGHMTPDTMRGPMVEH